MIIKGTTIFFNNWGFLMLPHELGKMYRHLFLITFGTKLERPSNKEHITIVSPWDGVKVTGLPNRQMSVEITSKLSHNNHAFWLNVVSKDIDNFRLSLGLDKPGIPLHFCIGYNNDSL